MTMRVDILLHAKGDRYVQVSFSSDDVRGRDDHGTRHAVFEMIVDALVRERELVQRTYDERERWHQIRYDALRECGPRFAEIVQRHAE